MPERIRGENGWDGPVEIVLPGTVNWENDAKTLAALIQDSAPVGRGTLKTDLSLRRAGYSKIRDGRSVTGFQLIVHNSYARVQDEGGDIPERFPKGYELIANDDRTSLGPRAGKALRWGTPGAYVFAKSAGPFHIEGQNYLQRGFDRWISARGHDGLQVMWLEDEQKAEAAA